MIFPLYQPYRFHLETWRCRSERRSRMHTFPSFSSISLRDDMGPVAADPMGELLVWGPGAFFHQAFRGFLSWQFHQPPMDQVLSMGCRGAATCDAGGATDINWLVLVQAVPKVFFSRPSSGCSGCVVVGDSAPIHRWSSFSASTVVGGRGSTVWLQKPNLTAEKNVGNGGNEWDDHCPMKKLFPTFSTSKLLCRILNHPASNWRRNIAA